MRWQKDILSEDEREDIIAGRNVAEVVDEDIQGDDNDSNNSNGGKERVGSYNTEVEYELDSDVENSDAKGDPGEIKVDNLSLQDGEFACTLSHFEYKIDGRLMPRADWLASVPQHKLHPNEGSDPNYPITGTLPNGSELECRVVENESPDEPLGDCAVVQWPPSIISLEPIRHEHGG
ncbi:hypothetical protein GN958_ATG23605 [Phytophthora infestans]|uniref:Uncharacterized protein n=1 Tax=Phytophthora infestans TaxID=4787 RepID=A0A8S9TL08_PHYIN|nr:hypothetical protein GN958_ATG23653 [Phytophthora infestans]KAF4127204.1 hypothetical protein GN958_ATG23605 [Phytophthora infestans]